MWEFVQMAQRQEFWTNKNCDFRWSAIRWQEYKFQWEMNQISVSLWESSVGDTLSSHINHGYNITWGNEVYPAWIRKNAGKNVFKGQKQSSPTPMMLDVLLRNLGLYLLPRIFSCLGSGGFRGDLNNNEMIFSLKMHFLSIGQIHIMLG